MFALASYLLAKHDSAYYFTENIDPNCALPGFNHSAPRPAGRRTMQCGAYWIDQCELSSRPLPSAATAPDADGPLAWTDKETRLDVGTALGPRYLLTPPQASGVWARNYSNALVLVNPWEDFSCVANLGPDWDCAVELDPAYSYSSALTGEAVSNPFKLLPKTAAVLHRKRKREP